MYWAPAGYSFPTSYKTVVNGYLANVAAASATNGNVFGVADEYYQNVGSGNQFISYHVTAGSEVDATDSYPAEGNSLPNLMYSRDRIRFDGLRHRPGSAN